MLDQRTLTLNGVARIFQIETLVDPKARTEGFPPWRRLIVEGIFAPKQGELFLPSPVIDRLICPLPNADAEGRFREVVSTAEAELKRMAGELRLNVGISVEAVTPEDQGRCRCTLDVTQVEVQDLQHYLAGLRFNPDPEVQRLLEETIVGSMARNLENIVILNLTV